MAVINNVVEQTTNYEVFVNGNRSLGTATVDLPELNYVTNEISGAGVAGKFDSPTLGHTENMEVTLHWRNIFETPIQLLDQDAVMLTLRAAVQSYDAGTGLTRIIPVRADVRALAAGSELGKLEPGEQSETTNKFNLDYIKIEIDNKTIVEHDKFNFKHVINGKDILAKVRSALGI